MSIKSFGKSFGKMIILEKERVLKKEKGLAKS